MTANAFPFHMNPSPTREGLDSRREEGDFDGPDNEVLAARVQGELIGFVVVEDLESIAPLFDIRLANEARGKGLGTETVRELVRYLFREHPNIVRIEGQTREGQRGHAQGVPPQRLRQGGALSKGMADGGRAAARRRRLWFASFGFRNRSDDAARVGRALTRSSRGPLDLHALSVAGHF